jgi:site-specific DNA-cytosine methylase
MKILIACEESQAVTIEFRKLGFEAYSCDILECSGGHPEWHIQGDVKNVLRHALISEKNCEWDVVIAFPPCTDLAVSGARWFKEKQKDGRQQESIMFFEFFTQLKNTYVAIENPIGIMSRLYRKPDQIIQPWQFGHGETKATCLWLKNLPLLIPTDIVEGREQKIWKLPPSPDRGTKRSKTYHGIAKAMAEQWGNYLRGINFDML